MTTKPTPPKRHRSKYEDPVRINATAEETAQSIFWRKPKPKKDWRYLQRPKASA